MKKGFLQTAMLMGAISVAIGAFGAHGLKKVADDYALGIFETAVRYQFFHVFALMAAGMLFKFFPNKYIKGAGYLFMIGMLLFSGSLYLLCMVHIKDLAGFEWLGPVTPLGGLAFIAGWLLLLAGISKKAMA